MDKELKLIANSVKQYYPRFNDRLFFELGMFSSRCREKLQDYDCLSFEKILEVVKVLADLRMDEASIMAGLLHDLYDEQQIIEEAKGKFDHNFFAHIEGYGLVNNIETQSNKIEDEDDYIKMVLSVAKDIDIIMLLIANRYIRLFDIKSHPTDKEKLFADKTMKLYAPLTHRLGLGVYKEKMEIKSCEIIYPKIYKRLTRKLAERNLEFDKYLVNILQKLESEFKKIQVKS